MFQFRQTLWKVTRRSCIGRALNKMTLYNNIYLHHEVVVTRCASSELAVRGPLIQTYIPRRFELQKLKPKL